MPRTLTLAASGDAVLDGSGAATVALGPSSPGEVWFPAAASVGASEAAVTSEAQCKLYCGPVAAEQYFVDGTITGSAGDRTGNVAGKVLCSGQQVIAVWAGGDPGAPVFLNVDGIRQ